MSIQWFDRETLIQTVPSRIHQVDSVLEIGCGIRPQQFVKPRVYICCDPHDEYLAILKDRFAGTNAVVIQATAQEIVKWMPDKSVDSIFMIDLIEHIEKGDGPHLIAECERIARQQIVVFTPLGFLPQDYQPGETDGWNLHGGEWQVHKSAWTPDDFDESWEVLATSDYHFINAKGEQLDPPTGAFWAIKNMQAPPTAEVSAVPGAAQAQGLSQPETTRVLIKLLSDIDRRMQDLADVSKLETAFHLCRREADLAMQAMQVHQREARYDSLLLVRLARRLRRISRAHPTEHDARSGSHPQENRARE